jgi:hypothetical protein
VLRGLQSIPQQLARVSVHRPLGVRLQRARGSTGFPDLPQ